MNSKISFSELTSILASKVGDEKNVCEEFLRELFALIAESLAGGENVKVKGLGTFKVQTTAARRSIDVSTGREIKIPVHRKVTFTPDKSMAETVNMPFSAFETVELSDGFDPGVDVEPLILDTEVDAVEEHNNTLIEKINDTPHEVEDDLTDTGTEQQHKEDPEENNVDIFTEEEASVVVNSYERRNCYLHGFISGLLTFALIVAIGLGVWYVVSPDAFLNIRKEHHVEKIIITKIVPQELESVGDIAKDTVDASAVSSPVPPATKPSDSVVYDTISLTRFLTTMAKKHYGNYHLWPYIYDANPNLGHPDRIRPGTRIRIPSISELGINPKDVNTVEKAKKRGVEIYSKYK